MSIADDMKRITENIMNSHDARAKGLGVLAAGVRKTLETSRSELRGFAADRKKMGEKQAGNLAEFVNGLAKTTGTMLKGFQTGHKEMSGEQAGSLEAFVKGITGDVAAQLKAAAAQVESYHADREKMAGELRKSLAKAAKEIETRTKKSLKDFHDAHAGMSDALKTSLTEYVGDVITGPVGKLLGGYAAEMTTARTAWREMAGALARSRNGGGQVPAAAKTVEKKSTRKGKKKGK